MGGRQMKRGTLGKTSGVYAIVKMLTVMCVLFSTVQVGGAASLGAGIPCEKRWGVLKLHYTKGTSTTFLFDLCDVIDCGGHNASYRGYDVWLCVQDGFSKGCNEGRVPSSVPVCGWDQVAKYTGPWEPWGPIQFTGHRGKVWKEWWRNVTLSREGYTGTSGLNPLALSLGQYFSGPDGRPSLYLRLGAETSGKDPTGVIRIDFLDPPRLTNKIVQASAKGPGRLTNDTRVVQVDYTTLNPLDILELATGYKDSNLWLDWMAETAREQKMEGCVACASARPQLLTEPAPIFPLDKWGYGCMLGLTREASPPNCTTLASIYPPIDNRTKPGPFTPHKGDGNHTCYNFTGNIEVGNIPVDWCGSVFINGTAGHTIGHWARAGLYLYCGQQRLRTRLPRKARGLCALVRLGAPLMLIGERAVRPSTTSLGSLTRRRRRHVLRRRDLPSFDPTVNSPTYIDAIGVPRGVPDEFKLADQVAGGFENIPILSALFPITPNKNVDRINYVHYNVLRLSNLTRDAIEGLAEQLGPTSLMAVQNRLALDMLLAEKGGVCAMFGDVCCTYIPNNTAPDGSVTKALEGLRTLSKTMHEQSGIHNVWDDWLTSMFGQWKDVVASLLISIATFAAILVTCGCCCIPCLRALSVRLISSAIEKREPPGLHMMPLLGFGPDEDQDETVFQK